MDSLAPVAAESRISGWMARMPVRTIPAPRPTPKRVRSRRANTIAIAPQIAETMTPANALEASTGIRGERRSRGITASEGNGFQTNPMAARWGSRLKTT